MIFFTRPEKKACSLKKIGYKEPCRAGVAQLVEQRIRNAWVRCSSHRTGTIKKPLIFKGFFSFRKKVFLFSSSFLSLIRAIIYPGRLRAMNKISIRFFDDREVRAVWDDANARAVNRVV